MAADCARGLLHTASPKADVLLLLIGNWAARCNSRRLVLQHTAELKGFGGSLKHILDLTGVEICLARLACLSAMRVL